MRACDFGLFGSASSSTPVSFRRPSRTDVCVMPMPSATFISSHGIDSSRSCFAAIGRIPDFANAPSIWRTPESSGLSWKMSMSHRLRCEDAAEPLIAVQSLERARVAHQFLDGEVVDEAVAAVELHAVDRGA